MERIKAVARLAAMIAIVLFGCTWIPQWYARGAASAQAYNQLNEYMRSIQKELNGDQPYECFMSEAVFEETMTEEALSSYVDAWLNDAIRDRLYKQETRSEVKNAIIALYQSQKALARDSVYNHYVWVVRGISLAMILLSWIILWLLRRKEKRTKNAALEE